MPRNRAQRAGRASLGLVAVGLAVCALFLTVDHFRTQPLAPATSGQQPDQPFTRHAASPSPKPLPSTRPSAVAKKRVAARSSREPGAGAPHRVEIDALGIDVPVVPIRLEVSTLVPPPDPQTLGWWADGAVPGAKRGSAIITGHTQTRLPPWLHSSSGRAEEAWSPKAEPPPALLDQRQPD